MADIKEVYAHMLGVLEKRGAKTEATMLRLCYAMWFYAEKVEHCIRTHVEPSLERCLQRALGHIAQHAAGADLSQLFLGGHQTLVYKETDFETMGDSASTAVRNYMAAAMLDLQSIFNTFNLAKSQEHLLQFAGACLIGNKNYPNTTGMTRDTLWQYKDRTPAPLGLTTFAKWTPPSSRSIEQVLRGWLDKKGLASLYESGVNVMGGHENQEALRAQLARYDAIVRHNADLQMGQYHKKYFWQNVILEVAKQKTWGPQQSWFLFVLLDEIKKHLGGAPATEDLSWITEQEIQRMLMHPSDYAVKPMRAPVAAALPGPLMIQMANQCGNWQRAGFRVDQPSLDRWLAAVKWDVTGGSVTNRALGPNGPLINPQGTFDVDRIVGGKSAPAVRLKRR